MLATHRIPRAWNDAGSVHRRPRKLTPACVAVVVVLATSCSIQAPGSSQGSVSPPAPTERTSPATSHPAALAARVRALVATREVRSYAFVTVQLFKQGDQQRLTRGAGRVVRPDKLAVSVTSRGTSTDLVRLGTVTYSRVSGQPWRKVAGSPPPGDPLGLVTSVLERLGGLQRSESKEGTLLLGALSGAEARQLGIGDQGSAPPLAATLPASVLLDAKGRIVRFELTVELATKGKPTQLRQQSRFAGFDRQVPIVAPSGG